MSVHFWGGSEILVRILGGSEILVWIFGLGCQIRKIHDPPGPEFSESGTQDQKSKPKFPNHPKSEPKFPNHLKNEPAFAAPPESEPK